MNSVPPAVFARFGCKVFWTERLGELEDFGGNGSATDRPDGAAGGRAGTILSRQRAQTTEDRWLRQSFRKERLLVG